MFKIVFNLFAFIFIFLTISLDSGGNIKGEGNHTFYLYDKSSNAVIKVMQEDDAKQFFYLKNNLKGESVEFFNENSALNLITQLNAQYVFSEKGENFYCKYYYTDEIKDHVTINGHKVNLHLSYGKDVYTIGTPIIFGSF